MSLNPDRRPLLPMLMLLAAIGGCGRAQDEEAAVGKQIAEVAENVEVNGAPEMPVKRWQAPASCPPYADPDRPSGSNCLGILPESCGADRAFQFVGQSMSDDVLQVVRGSASGGVRTFVTGQPVTDDLRPGRLNIETDETGTILSVDCF